MCDSGSKTEKKRRPELLCPAGSLEVLKVAVLYGADAVYIGGEAFSLRAGAKNFTKEEMAEGIDFAHARGVKVYVTANIFAHNDDLAQARDYFSELAALRPDAILISDPGLFVIERSVCPDIPVHISTQANNVNYGTFRFWYDLGVRRVVCGRELSLAEISQIRANIPDDMEIEAFVHGAMCISYSGRCLLSSYLTGRDANRGACSHPCRWKYALVEETRPGEYMPVLENERGTYIFNSKDLCMIGHIPQLISAGIDSMKIEGRMKTALYVATVARTYRKAIDDYLEGPEVYEANMEWYLEQIRACTFREFTTGFFFGKPDSGTQIYDGSTYQAGYVYLGIVGEMLSDHGQDAVSGSAQDAASDAALDAASDAAQDSVSDTEKGDTGVSAGAVENGHPSLFTLEQKNKFSVGESLEIMKPSGENVEAKVLEILDAESGIAMESAPHARQKLLVRLSEEPSPWDLLRRKV